MSFLLHRLGFARGLLSALWSGRPTITFKIKKMKPLIIIYGSTGTGKSDVGVPPARGP